MGKRFIKHRQHGRRIVIRGDTVDGQSLAFCTFVDQHELTPRLSLVLIPASFHGQSDRFHRRLAGGQAIACRIQIQVARPQTVRTVIAAMDAGEQMRAAHDGFAMSTPEIPEGGSIVSHRSSFRCM
jgi:hypothetical protein